MLSWRIGDVTVNRVVEMELPVPYSEKHAFLKQATPEALGAMPWLKPHFVREDGALMLSIHALCVEAPGIRLVIDTCIGNDKPRLMTRRRALQTDFLKRLEDAGFARETVDAVVCTHLHVDHVGWNTMLKDGKWVPTFPKARYLIGRKEFEHWVSVEENETPAIMADSVHPIFDAGLAEMVEMDHRISPELRLLPTPGHTPGHVSVVIESRGETAIVTGDMMHHPCQVTRPDWISEFDGDKQAGAARRHAMIAEWADKPLLVIGTHFAAPTAGHIRRDGESYRFEV
ncbi:MAG TPA: MBL fold metallo-hydrolase [Rhizomicrobium sp.]|nr:MBL fold metallo-hydrolase [Rhizomicrobium sp.]